MTPDIDKKNKHSRFPLDYKFASTLRFGEISPFLSLRSVPDDGLEVRNASLLRSLSLSSPLLQSLKMKKDYVTIPRRAILPNNWDRIYNNPSTGDDIDASKANCLLSFQSIASLSVALTTALGDESSSNLDNYSRFHYFMWLLAYNYALFSPDSLLSALRIPLYESVDVDLRGLFDKYYEVCQFIADGSNDGIFKVTFADDSVKQYSFYVLNSDSSKTTNVSECLRFFYDFCENPYIIAMSSGTYLSVDDFNSARDFGSIVNNSISSFVLPADSVSSLASVAPLNLSSLIAYQLACFEFYTNDKIDSIYSASQFRQLYDLFGVAVSLDGTPSGVSTISLSSSRYEWNGKMYEYDSFSAQSLQSIFNSLSTVIRGYYNTSNLSPTAIDKISATRVSAPYVMQLILMLFLRRRSLRYVDYFVGARTQPLAVSDGKYGQVEVSGNKFSVIDVTKNIQWQRFANQVVRAGSSAKHYLKSIFGTEPIESNDSPVMLGSVDLTIYGEEVQNTGDEQATQGQSITTNFKSSGSEFAFSLDTKEESIAMGLVSFEIARFYDRGLERQALEVDRFDMFNPFFQYIGDQPIYKTELDISNLIVNGVFGRDDPAFGYTSRDMQYKIMTDFCNGDFSSYVTGGEYVEGSLSTWLFKNLYSVANDPKSQVVVRDDTPTISSDFIRANQSELDRYFLNMLGRYPWNRYHFICVFANMISAKRPMSYNPQILG